MKKSPDVEYYCKGRKHPIAYSTTAVGDSLKVWSEFYPTKTIKELRALFDNLVGVEEEKKILDKYIELGQGERVPNFCMEDIIVRWKRGYHAQTENL